MHPSVNESQMFILSRTVECIVSLFDIKKQAIIHQFFFFSNACPHLQDYVLLMSIIMRSSLEKTLLLFESMFFNRCENYMFKVHIV